MRKFTGSFLIRAADLVVMLKTLVPVIRQVTLGRMAREKRFLAQKFGVFLGLFLETKIIQRKHINELLPLG